MRPEKKTKSYHEAFARFFGNPTRESLRELLQDNVGEFRSCDFKASWCEWPSLARHILAFANTGGGCVIVGVAEQPDKTLSPDGIANVTDKAEIVNGIKGFISADLLSRVDVVDFAYTTSEYAALQGKRFQVLFVDSDDTKLPFVALREGKGIRGNAIYIRREASSEEAGYEELQQILNRRIETGYSSARELDLKSELEQLKTLFDFLTPRHVQPAMLLHFQQMIEGIMASTPNPKYPRESFEDFVTRMIDAKKRRVQQLLGV